MRKSPFFRFTALVTIFTMISSTSFGDVSSFRQNPDDKSYVELQEDEASQIFGAGCGNSGGDSGSGDDPTDEPVHLSNGNLFYDMLDLQYSSREMDIQFLRHYNAQQVSDLANWFVDDGSGSWTIENGNLSGQGDICLTNNIFEKSIIEADFITLDPGAYNVECAWVNFRFTDKTKRYIAMLRKDGVLSLLKHNSSEYEDVTLASVQTCFSPYDWNRIKIVDGLDNDTGGAIQLYLNDVLIINYNETNPLPPGRVALESRFSHAHYDNIQITDNDTQEVQFDDFNTRDHDFDFGNWNHSYGSRIWERQNKEVVLELANYKRIVFTPSEPVGTLPQSYINPRGEFYQLTKYSTGYELVDTDDIEYNYDNDGKLQSIIGKNNNQISINYTSVQATVSSFAEPQTFLWVDDFNDSNLTQNGVGLYTHDDNTLSVFQIDSDTLQVSWNSTSDYFYSILARDGVNADLSNFENLEFDIKGNSGGENFSVVLRCSNGFYRLALSSYLTTATSWATVSIPIADFVNLGADITELISLNIEFNQQSSGSCWLDNIAFVESEPDSSNVSYYVQRPSSIIDTVGRSITFTYDTNGKIETMTDPANRVWTYEYDFNDFLTEVTYPDNTTKSYTYYQNGNMHTYTDQNNNTFTMTYLYNDKVYQQTDPNGKVTTFDYRWNITEVFNDKGESWIIKYDWLYPGFYKSQYMLEPAHLYDPNYTGKQLVWGSNGLVEEIIDPNGHSTKYEYDSRGNITKITDAMNNNTLYEYHASFNLVTEKTSAVNQIVIYDYDQNGNLSSVTDARGNATAYNYNANGELLSQTNAYNLVTNLQYNSNGDLISVTNPLNEIYSFAYDAVGRLTAQTNATNNTMYYEYDNTDNLISITDADNNISSLEYDANHNRISKTDSNGGVTQYEYNCYNRVSRIIDPYNKITQFQYDGNDFMFENEVPQTKITDANNKETEFEYNSINQLIRINYPNGFFLRFKYDYKGNLIKIINQNNEITEFIYNPLDRLWKKIFPDLSYTEYLYDNVGNIVYKKAPNGITTDYTYDDNNNLIGIDYENDTDVTFLFDKLNRLIRMTDAIGQTDLWYDNANRLIKVQDAWATMEYTYDNDGRKTAVILDNETVTSYSYDDINRLTSVESDNDTFEYTYDNDSIVPDRLDYPNGAYTEIIRDKLNNINQITHYNPLNNVIVDFEYTRDNTYNIVSEEQTSTGYTYTYDNIYQLTERSDGQNSISYKYDPAGNHIDPDNGSVTVTETYPQDNEGFPTVNGNNRSLFVRNHADDETDLLTDQQAQSAFFSFCAAPHGDSNRAIDRIYLSLGWHGENSFTDNEGALASFISTAHQNSIEVYYVGGHYSWFVPVNGVAAYNTHFIDLVLDYNTARQSSERFDGILCDIEPFSLDSNDEGLLWPDDHNTIISRYVECLQDIRTSIEEYENDTSDSLPFGDCIFTNYEDTKLDAILPELDFVGVMNYKDNDADLISAAANEMTKAEYYSKDVVMIFNTTHETNTKETFVQEGAIAMEKAINAFEDEYGSYSGYSEDCIFEYKTGYKDMSLYSIFPQDPIVTVSITGSINFQMDDNGNIVALTTNDGYPMTLSWNEEDRLEEVVIDRPSTDTTIEYVYDGKGRLRIRRQYEGEQLIDERRFVLDGWRVLEERDNDNDVLRRYVWGADMSGSFEGAGGIGGLLGLVDFTSQNPARYYYLYNGRGDVTDILDNDSAVIAHYEYDPFGTIESETGTLEQNFRFSTKYTDSASDLVYYGYRWYAPAIKQWLSRDPAEEKGGTNLYQFVKNGPLNLIDAFGLAYIGVRPIDGALGLFGFQHMSIVYDNGDAVGFGWNGIQDDGGYSYTIVSDHFSDSAASQAVNSISGSWTSGTWGFMAHDCWTFAATALRYMGISPGPIFASAVGNTFSSTISAWSGLLGSILGLLGSVFGGGSSGGDSCNKGSAGNGFGIAAGGAGKGDTGGR
ncbi:MAG: RHS repeat-associated core domain-containing protein [Candidatus Auribacterota bacterium]